MVRVYKEYIKKMRFVSNLIHGYEAEARNEMVESRGMCSDYVYKSRIKSSNSYKVKMERGMEIG